MTAKTGSEAAFMAEVVRLARQLGWGISSAAWQRECDELAQYAPGEANPLAGLVFHPRFSVGSEAGWPDLTLLRRRDGRALFRELKTDSGRVSPRQAAVLDLLRACGLDAGVWRPADMDRIGRELL